MQADLCTITKIICSLTLVWLVHNFMHWLVVRPHFLSFGSFLVFFFLRECGVSSASEDLLGRGQWFVCWGGVRFWKGGWIYPATEHSVDEADSGYFCGGLDCQMGLRQGLVAAVFTWEVMGSISVSRRYAEFLMLMVFIMVVQHMCFVGSVKMIQEFLFWGGREVRTGIAGRSFACWNTSHAAGWEDAVLLGPERGL